MNDDLISREYITGRICGLYSDGEKANKKDKVINEVMDIIDNAPTASPKEICIANVHFDKDQLQEIVDNAIIRCKDCKHQKKYWHEDKRMKDKGYWVYNCEFIDDPFVGSPVSGLPDEFCSSAERREPDEQE